MRKVTFLIAALLFLTGRSFFKVEKEVTTEEISFEQKIRDRMNENNVHVETMIDYEIKDDYIFVVSRRVDITRGLQVSIFKQAREEVEFIVNYEVLGTSLNVFGYGETPFITIIKDPSAKKVTVFNKPAKLVSYYDDVMDDYSEKVEYWIAYSYVTPDIDDIEIENE